MNDQTARDSTPLVDRHEREVADEAVRRARHRDGVTRPGPSSDLALGGALEWIPYGPPREHGEPLRIVATYGSVEIEYATIRRGAGLLDAGHRGTLSVAGADRVDFLGRMVTQQLADVQRGMVRPAFWLNRKGRIDADLLIAELGEDDASGATLDAPMWIDVDRHVAAATASALANFIFGEAVEFVDRTESVHRLALHGRTALTVLAEVTGASADSVAVDASDRGARRVRIAGADVVLIPRDQCGEPGVEVLVAVEDAATVWDALRSAEGVRPIGWHAYNIARIESGTPLFNVDFGTTNLPHETGVLRDRVSFTKGCYLGQEVVARMESLGKPKQTLVGLRIEGLPGSELLPEAGSNVCAIEGNPPPDRSADAVEIGPVVGTVTSSTLSPMLGAAPIAMAMVRTSHAAIGERVLVFGEGRCACASVSPLRAWGGSVGDGAARAGAP